MKISTKKNLQGYLFIVPVFILLISISFYPLLRTIFLSFHEVRLANMNNMKYVGMKNFVKIFQRAQPNFLKDIVPATIIYVAGSVIGQILIGFLFATLISQKFLKGRGAFRSIMILPWVISGIIISISWRFMYEPRLGIINNILSTWGVKDLPTWLNDPNLVLPSLIIANIWHGLPFSFIIQTSGLQSIPEEVYEAATVDGANGFQRLKYITLPMIRRFIIINLVMTSMNTINSFDFIYATTKGGPLFKSEVMAVHMYRRAFDFGKLGEGSAVAVLILLLNIILTVLYLNIKSDKAEN
jgi:multiple sugar transport system permease protein